MAVWRESLFVTKCQMRNFFQEDAIVMNSINNVDQIRKVSERSLIWVFIRFAHLIVISLKSQS